MMTHAITNANKEDLLSRPLVAVSSQMQTQCAGPLAGHNHSFVIGQRLHRSREF